MATEDALLERERTWAAWFRGIDSETNNRNDPAANVLRGFLKWLKGFAYRGYAVDDDGTPYEDAFYCPIVWSKNPVWWLLNVALGLLLNLGMVLRTGGKALVSLEWLRAHEGGHTTRFGRKFPKNPDGSGGLAATGLDHAPLKTFDVMLPGHLSPLRMRDPRGIVKTYKEWKLEGKVRRIREG